MAIRGNSEHMVSVPTIGQSDSRLLPAIRLSSRAPVEGPERELVASFLARGVRRARRGTNVTAFIEPRLETGFPDIVVAYWRPKVFEAWDESRSSLAVDDVRILHFLHGVRGADMETLCRLLDPKRRKVAESLERLRLAKLVRYRCGVWVPRALSSMFGISDLVAVEAKVRDWQTALEQAHFNRWFASMSYVLLPATSLRGAVLERATAYGVGIIGRGRNGQLAEVLASAVDNVPRSYGSWMFNEWVGRSIAYGKARGRRR
jgi:hypothetical protein